MLYYYDKKDDIIIVDYDDGLEDTLIIKRVIAVGGDHLDIKNNEVYINGKKLKEVVAYTPLDRIVLETDAPYLAPTPFRGKRNCSAYLTYVAQEIANIKGIDVDKVYEVTFANGKRLYRMQSESEN